MIFPITDIIAIVLFFAAWAGYSHYVDTRAIAKRPVAVVLNDYRLRWMERMLERENRMPDINIHPIDRRCRRHAGSDRERPCNFG